MTTPNDFSHVLEELQTKYARQDEQISNLTQSVSQLVRVVEQQGQNMQQAISEQAREFRSELTTLSKQQTESMASRGQVSLSTLMTVMGLLGTWTALIMGALIGWFNLQISPIELGLSQMSHRIDRYQDQADADLKQLLDEVSLRDELSVYRARYSDEWIREVFQRIQETSKEKSDDKRPAHAEKT